MTTADSTAAPVFRTRLTELFGIRHPLLLGRLHHLGESTLVAAVVNAGAMGYITARSFGDLILSTRTKARVYRDGDVEEGIVSLGPAGGFADRIESAGVIGERLMTGARQAARVFTRASLA